MENKSLCFFEKPDCETKVVRWYNSKGELFKVCPHHLKLLQMVVDDFEQVSDEEYRVVKSQSENI